MALLSNPSLNLGWVKAHVGVHDNETADNLEKTSNNKSEIHYLPAPKRHLKNLLHRVSIKKCQQERAIGDADRTIYSIIPKVTKLQCHGQENQSSLQQDMVSSPSTSAGSTSIIPIFVPVEKLVHHFTTLRPAI
ncbi:hypothetical protein AVEN_136828-1 [Araneus ventricosus]|uniref:Uncharacterized protein n=1 Tax=Araneus ventricosus TaxID=182803 RepID=A0A4Y2JRE4_ARAVE|nr:hypothetical protein AVEN_136828-1 [Araneus ventricosus]